jgi:hypothetical protein
MRLSNKSYLINYVKLSEAATPASAVLVVGKGNRQLLRADKSGRLPFARDECAHSSQLAKTAHSAVLRNASFVLSHREGDVVQIFQKPV